jgi:hypothetical protein
MKDYRDILKQVATDFPNLFTKDLEKAKTTTGKIQKVETYVNNLNKAELGAYSKKILKEKYAYIDQQKKSSATLIQNAVRGHDARAVAQQLKYQALANATASRQFQKELSSATRVQTQFRSHLARQEFERQQAIGVPFVAQPELYSLVQGTGPLTQSSVFTQDEMDAFFA